MKTKKLIELQEKVISTCVHQISKQQQLALEGIKHRQQTSSPALKKMDPYCFKNFKHVLPRVEGYVECMKKCGVHWLVLNFKFPLIWCLARPYKDDFSLTKEKEKHFWNYLVTYKGYLDGSEPPKHSYSFSSIYE